jgi:hypothetical protein
MTRFTGGVSCWLVLSICCGRTCLSPSDPPAGTPASQSSSFLRPNARRLCDVITRACTSLAAFHGLFVLAGVSLKEQKIQIQPVVSTEQLLSAGLRRSEKLLWSGRPRQGVFLTEKDVGTINYHSSSSSRCVKSLNLMIKDLWSLVWVGAAITPQAGWSSIASVMCQAH